MNRDRKKRMPRPAGDLSQGKKGSYGTPTGSSISKEESRPGKEPEGGSHGSPGPVPKPTKSFNGKDVEKFLTERENSKHFEYVWSGRPDRPYHTEFDIVSFQVKADNGRVIQLSDTAEACTLESVIQTDFLSDLQSQLP